MVSRINHVSFVVSDIERSVEWYSRHLGLEVATRQRQDNDYTRRLVGVPGAVLEVALLRLSKGIGNGPIVELIEYVTPKGDRLAAAVNDVGATHLAFEVDDLNSLYAELSGEPGVDFHTSPVAIEEGVNKGGWTCYLNDPDGNKLELHQPPRGGQS
jgi:catechol 2,3-dioxygenase-like lactoylglutathione lyase family enzyme